MKVKNFARAMFSLTDEERRIVVFVLSVFVLGAGMKHCRDERRNHWKKPPPRELSLPARSAPSPQKAASAMEDEAVPNPD